MKEDQLREDQRREALARSREQEPHAEETLPPPVASRVEEPPTVEEPKVEQPRREEPRIDSKALLESAGLVMIETDRTKAPSQQAEEEPQHLGRPRRERPKPPPQEEELQQVETRK
jgi:hypothetical protein